VRADEGGRPLTAYAVGKLLEPATYIPGKDGYTSNKWSRYAAGTHRPTRRSLDQLDAQVSGARDWIDAPHWRLLNCSRALRADDDVLRQLAPPLFDALFGCVPSDRKRLRTKALQDLCLDELSSCVNGIEALCAAVWVLRDARENGDQWTCLEVGAHLHNILLMTVSFGIPFLIRASLITFFHRHVFPLASSTDVIINPSLMDLFAASDDFLIHLMRLEDDGVVGDPRPGDTSQWRMMLEGTFGEDIQCALSPTYEVRAGSTSVAAADFVFSRSVLRNWGQAILDSNDREPLIPETVRRQACRLEPIAKI